MKHFKLFLSLVVLATLCLIVGCSLDNVNKHTTHVDKNNDGLCDDCKINLVLDTPVVTVSEEGVANWASIENAVSYIYKLNGAEMATMKTSFTLADGDKLQVKAVAEAPYSDSEYSEEVTFIAPTQIVYGLPTPLEGFYMRDADVIEESDTVRYLLYTTNKTKASEDNVIAIRKGSYLEGGWVYGEETIIIEPSDSGWDTYLGSASIVKGEFKLENETYNYLVAYQGTTESQATSNQIGFALAKEIDGEYVKLGTSPVIEYDALVYGANMVGCYAPSLVNYDKASGIRLFYTLADAYGHFACFADFDLSDLSNISYSQAVITNAGELQGGDAVTMFPNADFAYDKEDGIFYAVKDVSPSPAVKPQFADEFELCHIAESELYTTDKGNGWISDVYKDFFDLGCDRCYSACIVSDMYGHVNTNDIVIIYNVCDAVAEYLYTQKFVEYTHSIVE